MWHNFRKKSLKSGKPAFLFGQLFLQKYSWTKKATGIENYFKVDYLKFMMIEFKIEFDSNEISEIDVSLF